MPWDCPNCGCQAISDGLDFCPACRKERSAGPVPADAEPVPDLSPEPAQSPDDPAAPEG